MRSILLSSALFAAAVPATAVDRTELRPVERRESLTGTHVRYKPFIDGVEIVGEPTVAAAVAPLPKTTSDAAAEAVRLRFAGERVEGVERVAFATGRELKAAWRVTTSESAIRRFQHYLDAESLEIIETVPLFYTSIAARLFDANPVTVLNNTTLTDQNDSAAAVPQNSYAVRELLETSTSGPLSGPNIAIVDLEPPRTSPLNPAQASTLDRSVPGFEEVMAYYHLDQSQRYLQSLGFTGPRRIITRPLKVDAHGASGQDNSYYAINAAGEGILYFGDGGVDDAEDPDILLHEYGHAIHESIAPWAFLGRSGGQPRALGEGFGDYWAFSMGYSASVASGRDPFCIGDWDARCAAATSTGCAYPANADCLRRVDGSKTMDQFNTSDAAGTEHRNGEIWSSALREIFLSFVNRDGLEQGRRNADRLMIESLFSTPVSPTFRTAAERLLDADRRLYGGINAQAICAAMVSRKIISAAECGERPRGDFTTFASATHGDIPDDQLTPTIFSTWVDDDRIIDSVQVRVHIIHPYRGDLRLSLVSPSGVRVLLQTNSNDSGDDLNTTFGHDTQSRESLDAFRGSSAFGEWRLEVTDVSDEDIGRLVSWSLLIRFQGDTPLPVRPAVIGDQALLPIPGSEPTELRLVNTGAVVARVTLLFTPEGADGASDFAAVVLAIAPGEAVRLSDVVTTHFRASGPGVIEIQGELSQLAITGRTGQSRGLTLRPLRHATTAGSATLHIPHLRTRSPHTTILGIAESTGAAGLVQVVVHDVAGNLVHSDTAAISAYGHIVVPVHAVFEIGRAEVRVLSGGARVAAYAIVRDTVSNDSVFVPAEVPGPRQPKIIPAVIRGNGQQSTAWRSDVAISNLTSEWQDVVLAFGEARASVRIAPRGSVVATDVVASVFGRNTASGSLVVESQVPDQILVSSRTYALTGTGSAAEEIAARPISEATGQSDAPVTALVFEQSDRFRTNIGGAEVSGNDVTVQIRFFESTGEQISTVSRFVPARGHLQFSLAQAGVAELIGGYVSLQVTAGFGRILAYTSSVDNQSGDSVYIPAR